MRLALLLAAAALAAQPPCNYDRAESVAPGIEYRERCFFRGSDGPFTIQTLEAGRSARILPARARGRAAGKETVSSMALRNGAAAAVNAGYFFVAGPYAGAPDGVYQYASKPLGSGRTGDRTALVFCRGSRGVAFDVVDFAGRVTAADGATLPIAALNRARGADELLLYRPELGEQTLTSGAGVEAALDAEGRVLRVEGGVGSTTIPSDGVVLSGAGAAAEWLWMHAPPGARLRVEAGLSGASCDAEHIAGGGPLLVRDGKPAVRGEKFAHQNVRHPRTAAALTTRGTLLFLTLDGRQPHSVGMRLDELAETLVELGAREAMNLDGGGSTTMFVSGAVRNSPSDGRERPVSDAILIYP